MLSPVPATVNITFKCHSLLDFFSRLNIQNKKPEGKKFNLVLLYSVERHLDALSSGSLFIFREQNER